MMVRLQSQVMMPAFLRDAARQVRAITGFDRAMIYRFHEDGVGEVVAEAARSPANPFLGLHYPASDIPVQARALYLRSPFRVIADVHAQTSAILPQTVSTAPLDLSLAVTRAVSPVHLEYLRNRGVGASLSISIIVEGRLWGLIACHHDTARLPSFVMRTAAELFGAMFSLTLESRPGGRRRRCGATTRRSHDPDDWRQLTSVRISLHDFGTRRSPDGTLRLVLA